MSSDIAAQIKCVERELKYRDRVYPRLVQSLKMSSEEAAREIRVMRDVLDTLKSVDAKKNPRLF